MARGMRVQEEKEDVICYCCFEFMADGSLQPLGIQPQMVSIVLTFSSLGTG